MLFPRQTVRETVSFTGVGLHTGAPVSVSVHPGEDGIAFRLGSDRTPAHPSNVTGTNRCVRLGEVGTVEHLMASFAALEITDAEVELTAPEMPGLDGSAGPYYRALRAAGVEQLGERELPELFTRIFLQEESGLKIAIAKGQGHWRFLFDLGQRWPREQAFETMDVIASFPSEIADARTIVLTEEIPAAEALGLGRGLDEESVLILGVEGYLNEPRFSDEAARHKLLDLIGDLYLSGVPIGCLNVVAERSGHHANVHAAALLAQAIAT